VRLPTGIPFVQEQDDIHLFARDSTRCRFFSVSPIYLLITEARSTR